MDYVITFQDAEKKHPMHYLTYSNHWTTSLTSAAIMNKQTAVDRVNIINNLVITHLNLSANFASGPTADIALVVECIRKEPDVMFHIRINEIIVEDRGDTVAMSGNSLGFKVSEKKILKDEGLYPPNVSDTTRRSAQIHPLDIRHPDTIEIINTFSLEELKHSNWSISITDEFLNTYLQESEAEITAGLNWARSGSVEPFVYTTIPLWQPMIDCKAVGDPVSAKALYVKLGGSLCGEITLPSRQQ